jgi:hypothetical protein
VNADLLSARSRLQKSDEWYDREKSRERLQLIGLLTIALILFAIVFLRFGKTIPWGVR